MPIVTTCVYCQSTGNFRRIKRTLFEKSIFKKGYYKVQCPFCRQFMFVDKVYKEVKK